MSLLTERKQHLSALALDMVDDSDTGIQAYDEDGNLNWVGKTDNLTSVQAPTFSISGLTSTASASGDSIYLIIDNGTAIDTTIRSKVNSNEMNFTVPANLKVNLPHIPQRLLLRTWQIIFLTLLQLLSFESIRIHQH